MIFRFDYEKYLEEEKIKIKDARELPRNEFMCVHGVNSVAGGRYKRYREGMIDVGRIPFGAVVGMTNLGLIEPDYSEHTTPSYDLFAVLKVHDSEQRRDDVPEQID